MRLGIDLDGVVANFTRGWMRFYNRDFGANLNEADSQHWDDIVTLTHFESADEFWQWSTDIDGRSVFAYLEPFPGAIEALHDLRSDGHEILLVTDKPDFAIDDTHDWISRHRVPATEIHFVADKWLIDCEVYLDDGPHVLLGLVKHRPDRVVCRYVRPWNRPVPGVVDVSDFDEFRELVSSLAERNRF